MVYVQYQNKNIALREHLWLSIVKSIEEQHDLQEKNCITS